MQFLKFQNFCEIKKFVTLPMSRSIYEIDYLAFSNRILFWDFSLVKTDGPWEIFHLYIPLYNAAIFIRLVINNSCLWKIRENEIQNKKYIQNFFMDQSLDFFLEWDDVWWKWKMRKMIQLGYLNVKKKFCASKAIQEDSQESISYKK